MVGVGKHCACLRIYNDNQIIIMLNNYSWKWYNLRICHEFVSKKVSVFPARLVSNTIQLFQISSREFHLCYPKIAFKYFTACSNNDKWSLTPSSYGKSNFSITVKHFGHVSCSWRIFFAFLFVPSVFFFLFFHVTLIPFSGEH